MLSSEPLPDSNTPETLVEMARLSGLSDGVFAIALTLMVLDIRLPEAVTARDLPAQLLALAPRFLVYLISFVVIGGAWGSHQRMLSQIKRGDGLLVWFNLLSLLFVTLVPATAALLGRFPSTVAAQAGFALDVILIQLTALWLWRHASRHHLVNPALDARVVASIGRRLSFSALAFAVSVPLAFLHPALAYALWVGVFALIFTTDWLSWQQALSARQATIPLEGASAARIVLQHAASHLRIGADCDDTALLTGVFGSGLKAQVTRADGRAEVQLAFPDKQGFMSMVYPWTRGLADSPDWTIGLTRQIPLALRVETGSSQATLDLSALRVTELHIEAGASSLFVTLPAQAGQTAVTIEAGSASLVLRVPPDVAAHVLAGKALATAEVDLARFPMIAAGREYCSPGFATAANRVEIDVRVMFGSVKIV